MPPPDIEMNPARYSYIADGHTAVSASSTLTDMLNNDLLFSASPRHAGRFPEDSDIS